MNIFLFGLSREVYTADPASYRDPSSPVQPDQGVQIVPAFSSDYIDFEMRDRIAVLTLNRPEKRNAEIGRAHV